MRELFVNYPVVTASLISFVAAIANVLYTRKKFKSEKYIETITNQRIKLIENLRNDLSSVVSELYSIYSCYSAIRDYEVYYESGEYFDDVKKDHEAECYNQRNLDMQRILESSENRTRLTCKIDLCILKLNQKSDCELISLLEEIKRLLWSFDKDYKAIELLHKKILGEATKVLKNEWEKVKLEVIKGKLVT